MIANYVVKVQRAVTGRWVGDKDEVMTVEVEVNVEKLIARLAHKARYNASKRSAIASGAVRVRVSPVKEGS